VSCRTGDKGSALANPGRLAFTNEKSAICAASGDEKTGLANRIRGKISKCERRFRSRPNRAYKREMLFK